MRKTRVRLGRGGNSPAPRRGHSLWLHRPDLSSGPLFGSPLLASRSAPRFGSPLGPRSVVPRSAPGSVPAARPPARFPTLGSALGFRFGSSLSAPRSVPRSVPGSLPHSRLHSRPPVRFPARPPVRSSLGSRFGSPLSAPRSVPRSAQVRSSLGSRPTQSSSTYGDCASGSVFWAAGTFSALPDAGICCPGNRHQGNQHGRVRLRGPGEPLKV